MAHTRLTIAEVGLPDETAAVKVGGWTSELKELTAGVTPPIAVP
jgi:hypothetical protein